MSNPNEDVSDTPLNHVTRQDIVDVLDHVAASGAFLAHENERIQNFKIEGNPQNCFHREDERIYPGRHNRMYVKGSKRKLVDDTHWNLEYGDPIHPIAFKNARLSTKMFRMVDTDGPNLSIDTTLNTGFSLEEGPKVLLNHCWQRALHLSSNIVDIHNDVEEQEMEETDLSDVKNAESHKDARLQCEALDISMLRNEHVCRSCNISFDTNEQACRHYYGTSNVRGCCWNLVEKRNLELLDEALEAEVKATIRQVFKILATATFQDGIKRPKKKLNWHNVLSILTDSVIQNTNGASIHTIQPNSEDPPLPLNAAVMDAVNRRLLKRYSAVPK
jgi:hypothetical protein